MQRVKGNEQDHSLERVEKSAQKKLKTSLTESALLEMDGNATTQELPLWRGEDAVSANWELLSAAITYRAEEGR